MGGSGSQAPQAPSPGVFGCRIVRPPSESVHPVSALAGKGLRIVEELHGNSGESVDSAVGVGLSGGDDEHASHVIGAVAVLGPGVRETGVLEGAATIGHPQ